MQNCYFPVFSVAPSTGSPLDDSLKDLTDVAPCRKRRFRHFGAPDSAVKKPNSQSNQRKRYIL